jgi:serine O-acetyltransferase
MVTHGNNRGAVIDQVVAELCAPESYGPVVHRAKHDVPMPSVGALVEIVESLRGILFPGYFGPSDLRPETMRFHVGSNLDRVARLLQEQVKYGFCYACAYEPPPMTCAECDDRAAMLTHAFLAKLPWIRQMLATDVQAAFVGDPAVRRPGETIYCYPSLRAMTNHRIAHELSELGIPLIPRIIAENAHSATGIDIHPGARIGPRFFMDHGTGIVIGETCEIGENVRLYQGVTLGAKSFPLDKDGNPIKGIPRHPIVEDDVIIYAGATLLGRIRIGRGAVIGGNLWVTNDVPPGTRLLQRAPTETPCDQGGGI